MFGCVINKAYVEDARVGHRTYFHFRRSKPFPGLAVRTFQSQRLNHLNISIEPCGAGVESCSFKQTNKKTKKPSFAKRHSGPMASLLQRFLSKKDSKTEIRPDYVGYLRLLHLPFPALIPCLRGTVELKSLFSTSHYVVRLLNVCH